MKEKNFNYTSLYLYDRDLVDKLEQDFRSSDIRSKSQYLTHLIGLGLQVRKNGNTETANMDYIARELNDIKVFVSNLQRTVMREFAESEVYKDLLCYITYLVKCIIYEQEPNEERTELGFSYTLPSDLYYKLKNIQRRYGVA